jgi:hypothetical protein
MAGDGFSRDRRLDRAFAIAIGQRGWKRQPEGGRGPLARRQPRSGSYDSDEASQSRSSGLSPISEPLAAEAFCPRSDRGVLLCPGRVCGVEFPVALFDAASPFVSGKDDADVVWASAFACSGDFLLRFAGCQGKDLIPQRRRATLASRLSGCSALAPTSSRWSGSLSFRGRHFSWGRPPSRPAPGVTREHTLGRLQFAELATELLALCIDPSQCLAETLLLFRDFIQCRHSEPFEIQ